jgi:hypothetical protein
MGFLRRLKEWCGYFANLKYPESPLYKSNGTVQFGSFACFSHLQCKWLGISQLVLIPLLVGNQLDFPVPGGQANTACLWLPAQS